ncbi:MAG: class I SAM-dependent methyltransferase [Chlamydiia bacterium]|nr:class I SAM-dependent methyltransferase [Chlamydiia bacterium]
MKGYELIDSGRGRKLERFGNFTLARPAAQAVWNPKIDRWKFDAEFTREEDKKWSGQLPESWEVEVSGLKFKLSSTDFGHLGIFPEQAPFWEWVQDKTGPRHEILNLFAYSGGSTLAAAKGGAKVCHLDASKGMVDWARQNAALNDLQDAPIRWIVEDVHKFLQREIRRERFYDGIIFDPPSFGRGSKGELFKIEEDILGLLDLIKSLLVEKPVFVMFSCHTPGFTPTVMKHLMEDLMQGKGGKITTGEMLLQGERPLPSGTFARWERG